MVNLKYETKQKQRQMKLQRLFYQAIQNDPDVINKQKKLHSIYYCGAYRRYFINKQMSHKRLYFACYCNERLCPICGKHKAYKARIKLSTMFKYLNEHYQYKNGNPKYIPLFITLTIPNVPDNIKAFKMTFKKLHHKFRAMMSFKKFCGFIKGTKGSIQGGVSKIEVTYNRKKDTFHLHLHALVLVHRSYFHSRHYIKFNTWQNAWEYAWRWNFKKEHHHLEIKVERPFIKDSKNNKHIIKNNNSFKKAEEKAITEVTGYETKSDDFTNMLDKNNTESIDFVNSHHEQAQRAFNTAYFGTKNQNTYTNFGLLGKISRMYNEGLLDKYKHQDENIYMYDMNAVYRPKPKKYEAHTTKMNKQDTERAKSMGLKVAKVSEAPDLLTCGPIVYADWKYRHVNDENPLDVYRYNQIQAENSLIRDCMG